MAEHGSQWDTDAYLRSVARDMESYLDSCVPANGEPHVLLQAMRYSLLAGGKRLRPALCLAAAHAVGADPNTALPAAAAIEMVHTYSLIHDDLPVMDDDDLRHGRASNHKVFGDAVALLAGDALLTDAFYHLATSAAEPRRLQMVAALAEAAGSRGMVAGQVADMQAEGSDGGQSALEYIHLHKTGRLITASVFIGALHGDVSVNTLNGLKAFGTNLGLVYQMVDDLLDVTASTARLGKTSGKDVEQHKLTYPSLFGVERTRELIAHTAENTLMALEELPIDRTRLAGLCRYVVDRQY